MRVSIVLPTRNGADRVAQMLPRLLEELRELPGGGEVIAIDDGSTDATPTVLADWAVRHPAVRTLRTGGVGPGAARNRGIAVARGALVAFADDDDAWTPGRLVRQVAAMAAAPDAALSLTDYRHLDETRPFANLPTSFDYWPLWRRFRGHAATLVADAAPLVCAENAIGTSTVVARRAALDAVGGFDEALPSASDWDLWLKLCRVGPAVVLGEVGAVYAMRPGSVSAARGRRIAAMRTILSRQGDLPGWALRHARARLDEAESEAAEIAGLRLPAIGGALRAAIRVPSLRRFRRCAGLVKASFA